MSAKIGQGPGENVGFSPIPRVGERSFCDSHRKGERGTFPFAQRRSRIKSCCKRHSTRKEGPCTDGTTKEELEDTVKTEGSAKKLTQCASFPITVRVMIYAKGGSDEITIIKYITFQIHS